MRQHNAIAGYYEQTYTLTSSARCIMVYLEKVYPLFCMYALLFASAVSCHNPPLSVLLDHALPVLNHNRTDHNTKPMQHWYMHDLVTTIWCNCYTGKLDFQVLKTHFNLKRQKLSKLYLVQTTCVFYFENWSSNIIFPFYLFFLIKSQRTSHSFNENQPMHRKRNFLKIFCNQIWRKSHNVFI